MTTIHTLAPRAGSPGVRSTDRSRAWLRPGRAGPLAPPRPSRPAGAPMRYHRTGVAMSAAPHRKRPVTVATTVWLALAAGAITLWLGLVGNVGQVLNGDSGSSAAHVPDRLAVVRVEAGSRCRTSRTGWRPTRRPARWPTGSASSTT